MNLNLVEIYRNWIQTMVLDKDPTGGYGKCKEYAELMQTSFPKLRITKGLFHDWMWSDREHWWLVDDINKLIVDPTGLQHPTGGLIISLEAADRWEELTDEEIPHRVPTGRCMYCGEGVYYEKSFCSESHAKLFQEDLENGN